MQRYKELRLGQLRAFCECVRQKSFSAAARALSMSQPAIWQQVRALERDFGVGLLRRRGRHWEPSEDGLVLLELAASIVGSVDSLKDAFEQRRRDVPRSLVVLGSPGVLTEELARPVVDFCRQYPQVRTTVLSFPGLRTLDALVTGEADLAVLPQASEVGGQRQLLMSEPLCERAWVLAAPNGHPLACRRRLGLGDIARYPLILPEEASNWRKRVDELCRAAGLPLQVLVEVSMTLAARRYVSLGLGCALLPEPRDGLTFPRVVLRCLDDLLPPEPIVILWRRGTTPRPQARLFADFARAKLASPGPRHRR
jgi:DNA-binding transcriptional LysR family regulator